MLLHIPCKKFSYYYFFIFLILLVISIDHLRTNAIIHGHKYKIPYRLNYFQYP